MGPLDEPPRYDHLHHQVTALPELRIGEWYRRYYGANDPLSDHHISSDNDDDPDEIFTRPFQLKDVMEQDGDTYLFIKYIGGRYERISLQSCGLDIQEATGDYLGPHEDGYIPAALQHLPDIEDGFLTKLVRTLKTSADVFMVVTLVLIFGFIFTGHWALLIPALITALITDRTS